MKVHETGVWTGQECIAWVGENLFMKGRIWNEKNHQQGQPRSASLEGFGGEEMTEGGDHPKVLLLSRPQTR